MNRLFPTVPIRGILKGYFRLFAFALCSAVMHVSGWFVCLFIVWKLKRGKPVLGWVQPWIGYDMGGSDETIIVPNDKKRYEQFCAEHESMNGWKRLYIWLAFKMPHQNWKVKHFNYSMIDVQDVRYYGRYEVCDIPIMPHQWSGQEGVMRWMITTKDGKVWPFFYWVCPVFARLFPNRCLRVKLGWEPVHVKKVVEDQGTVIGYHFIDVKTRAKFSINPFAYFHRPPLN